MAKKNLYNGELLKTDDWGEKIIKDGVEYDCAAGSAVQNFIKSSLEEKWGCIYDNNKGKLYVFADDDNRDIYLEAVSELEPGQTEEDLPDEIKALKLAEMNSYSNYHILIELDTEETMPTNAVLIGQTGNKVVFVANTYDKDENPLLEGLTINYTITRQDGSKTMITHFKNTGEREELTVDNYITEGRNTVVVNILGSTSNAVLNTTIIYQVINLKITDNYDISEVHDVSEGKISSLSITWSVTGSSETTKFIEWYVDGVQQEEPDPIPSGQEIGNRTKNLSIDSHTYPEGRHNIQYRAWLTINEQQFYTKTYSKDFIVYDGGSKPIVAIAYEIPIGIDPLTGNTYLNPVIYDCVQYTGFDVPIAVYKNNTLNVNTVASLLYNDEGTIKVDSTYSNQVAEGDIWVATITPSVSGETILEIVAGEGNNKTTYDVTVMVEENKLNIHEETAGLVLDLRAKGKSNTAADRDVWEYRNGNEVYTTEFSGFTWDETSGWNDNGLLISNGNSIEVKYKPLTSQVATRGLTFEIEFSTFNVSDDDAVVCKIMNDGDNAAGLLITASEAIFTDNAKNKVSTKFKANENNRIAFVVDPSTEGKPLMFIYVNGALCGGVGYSTQISSFAADKYIRIEGNGYVSVKLKHIRIYNLPLSSDNILNNYILYRDTYQEMEELYNRNDLYATAGSFDLDRISNILPIMLLTDYDQERNNIENLMTFGKADKSTPILLKQVLYINNLDPSTSFYVEDAQMTCQGTSSMNYPIKNLRLYIKDKAKGKYGDWPLPITYTGDTSSPETMVSMSNPKGANKPSKPGKGKIAFKSGLSGTFSEGERKPQAVNCWTFKADYAESSSSHNTGVARLWNQVMRDAVLGGSFVSRTRAQSIIMSDASNRMDVRTCVDGFPCVVFYRYSEDDVNWKFLGKYNFNNDKSTESVFGFCDIPGIDYQEYDYEDIDEATYNAAEASTPDACSSSTTNFVNESALESTVRKKVGKDKPDETGQLPELVWKDYVTTFCPTPYEYSKDYQKSIVTVAGAVYMSIYEHKIMVSGNTMNKNYCVEVLENESPVTNFVAPVSKFDSDWEDNFEFRYPEVDADIPDADTKGGLTNLREFYAWCHSTMYTEDAYNVSNVVTVNAETKHDDSLVYKQPEDTYIDNGTYTAADYNEFKNLMKLRFQKEKWDYLDVFKVAAYYVYLMRFGAVDQVCKNSMFTSEGTVSYVPITTSVEGNVSIRYEETIGNHCKWFFINYDNDTILGLDNDGQMSYGPDIDRKTQTGNGYWVEHDHPTQEQIDECIGEYNSYDDLVRAVVDGEITPSNGDKYLIGTSVWEWSNDSAYAYAGHNSVLWNNLEDDEEFMNVVRDMDDALYRAGLTYNNAIRMFNQKQANMWCENILNKDAKIKYVDQYTQKNNNHLSKMHGPRTSHRTWWLSKRFTYYDSKFVSGEYMNTKILMKVQGVNNNPKFTIQPTEYMNYGWGVTNRSMGQTGISSEKDQEGHLLPITFDIRDGGMSTSLSMGDPIEIYASPYISELDLSNFAANLYILDLVDMRNDVLGAQLKRLILGKEGVINEGANGITNIGSLSNADKLEYLDIRGMREFNSIDLSENANVKELYAFNSGLLAITFANGSKIERLSLPEAYKTLILDSVNYLTKENIIFENNNKANLTTIHMKNCDLLKSSGFEFLREWYTQRDGNYANCVVDMEGVDWSISYADLDIIEELKTRCETFVLRGTITITDTIEGRTREETKDRVTRIKSLFGENCFIVEQNPPVVVTCTVPFIIINATATEVTANQNTVVRYSCEVYPAMSDNDPSITYAIVDGSRDGVEIVDDINFTGTLTTQELVAGSSSTLTIRATYKYTGSNFFTSEMDLTVLDPTYPSSPSMLRLSGPSSLKKDNEYNYSLVVNDASGHEATGSYDVVWSLNKQSSEYVDYAQSGVVPGNQLRYKLVTSVNEPDPSEDLVLTATVTNYGGQVNSKSITILILNDEVILTNISNPVVMDICHTNGWASRSDVLTKSEATGVTDIGEAFSNVSTPFGFHEFVEFDNVTSIPDSAFKNSSITGLTMPSGITSLGVSSFTNCQQLEVVTFDDANSIVNIPEYCFYGCSSINRLVLPDTVKKLKAFSFGSMPGITKIRTEDNANLTGVLVIPNTLTDILEYAFESNYENPNQTITSFELPDSIGVLEDGHLDSRLVRGYRMTEFIANPDNVLYSTSDGVLYNKTQQTLYKYPSAKVGSTYSPSIGCLLLYDYAFANTKLTTVNLSSAKAISSMGMYQFMDSSSLVTVDMNECTALKKITDYAFSNCTLLTSIIYPPLLEELGSYVFVRNNNLTSINIPNTVTNIGQHLISYCNGITRLVFPDSITASTGGNGLRYVVHECSNLEDIVFPTYAKVLDNLCDFNTSLTGVTLPVASYYDSEMHNVNLNDQFYSRYFLLGQSLPSFVEYRLPAEDNGLVHYIENGAIYKKISGGNIELSNVPYALTAFTISEQTNSIVGSCFYNHKIKNIVVPNRVSSIGSSCFQGSSLESAVMGTSVTAVGDRMFNGCSNLKNVIFKSSGLNEINYGSFMNCPVLSSITFSSLSIPVIKSDNQNFANGNHPFGMITITGGTRTPSTFTGRAVSGSKKIKVQYFNVGGVPSIDAYKTAQWWSDPLFTPTDGAGTAFDSGCGFDTEYLTFAGDIYIKIYDENDQHYQYDGTDVTQLPYADGIMGEYQDGGDYDGYYKFAMGADVVSNKPITVTMGSAGDTIGTLKPVAYEDHVYELHQNSASASPLMMTRNAKVLGSEDPNVVSKYDYDKLVSKINTLEAKFKNYFEE